jgi:lactoylglutathione lyase
LRKWYTLPIYTDAVSEIEWERALRNQDQPGGKQMPPEQMSVRLELFVQDMDQAIAFYTHVLGFEVLRREAAYASLRNGSVLVGLGPIAKLPDEHGGYFTRSKLRAARGLGVEIVLEVDDVHAMYEQTQSRGYPIEEPLQKRQWGLTDFRLVDPDGYYLRITSRA